MEETVQIDKAIKKNALNCGIILGAVSFVLSILTFYYITSMHPSMLMLVLGPILLGILIPILISIFITLDFRKKIGGFWNFKQATTGVFIMFIVAYALSSVLNFGFRKLIEPDMTLKMQSAMVEGTTAMMEKRGMDQDAIDKQADAVKKNFESQLNPTIGKMAMGVAVAIILSFVMAMIYGAIFKKERPLFLGASDYEDPTV